MCLPVCPWMRYLSAAIERVVHMVRHLWTGSAPGDSDWCVCESSRLSVRFIFWVLALTRARLTRSEP